MAHMYSSIDDSEPAPPPQSCPDGEDGCSCPLCPEQVTLNPSAQPIWYPDEPICTKREYKRLRWIRAQKRIARVGAPIDRYFTVAMLEAVAQVRRGIQGLSPDQPIAQANEAEKVWVDQHQGGASRD